MTILNFAVPPEWTEQALCAEVGGDIFFPEKGNAGGTVSIARQVCSLCTVREDCLEYALAYESGAMGVDTSYIAAGIWGGLSPAQRKRLLDKRAAARLAERSAS